MFQEIWWVMEGVRHGYSQSLQEPSEKIVSPVSYVPSLLYMRNFHVFPWGEFVEIHSYIFFYCLFVSAGLEFAYSQAPKNLNGVIMALFLSASGIGSYIANFLVAVVNSDWYPEKDPNQGHMEYFFFMMAGLMTLNFLLFLLIASSYKYKESSLQSKGVPGCPWTDC